ncbi:uncharacterized protein LOC119078327 [Bradysia coprophila]|uniref:uncharacterized protein LOC119078327 n=1 Tax=Bradysia coprophila TaxID=38358 RepID=UPI00187DB45A|nr:uncharacterized protein LOC119078327 [Bradysia coprophila]
MANHIRPVSNMTFSKSNNLPVANPNPKPNANENPNSNTNPKKHYLRPKKIDRMSNRAIEEIIKKNERLEEENTMLKNEVNILKAGVNGRMLLPEDFFVTDTAVQVCMDNFVNKVSIDTGTQTMVDDAVSGTDMGVQVSMDNFVKKTMHVLVDTGTQTQTMVDNTVSETDMEAEVSLENEASKAVHVSIDSETETVFADAQNVVWVKDAAVQAMISVSDIGTMTIAEHEVRETGHAVEVNQAAAKVDNNILLDLLPWLQVVREKDDFFNLERQLIFDETLQDDLISTAAVAIKSPDETNFLKCLLARVFSPDFFVNTLAFNARGKKVQFKGTITLRCFAVAMMRKFEKEKKQKEKKQEEEEETIEKFKNKIQAFVTDFKVLVKRNPNNWPQ